MRKLAIFFILPGLVILTGLLLRTQPISQPANLPVTEKQDQAENTDRQPNKDQTSNDQLSVTVPLVINFPADKQILNINPITVTGQTVAEGEVMINEIYTRSDSRGSFSAKIELAEGENYLFISANDEFGNFAEKEIIVDLEP